MDYIYFRITGEHLDLPSMIENIGIKPEKLYHKGERYRTIGTLNRAIIPQERVPSEPVRTSRIHDRMGEFVSGNLSTESAYFSQKHGYVSLYAHFLGHYKYEFNRTYRLIKRTGG